MIAAARLIILVISVSLGPGVVGLVLEMPVRAILDACPAISFARSAQTKSADRLVRALLRVVAMGGLSDDLRSLNEHRSRDRREQYESQCKRRGFRAGGDGVELVHLSYP